MISDSDRIEIAKQLLRLAERNLERRDAARANIVLRLAQRIVAELGGRVAPKPF